MEASTAGFRKLILWQKAQDLAASVMHELGQLRRHGDADLVRAQLVRAAGSVAANVAEGYGRFSPGAYRNHLSIARGSLFETESWIDLLYRNGHLPEDVAARLTQQCSEVGRLLTKSMRDLASGGGAVREEAGEYVAGEALVDS